MIIKLNEGLSLGYNFKYLKKSSYKAKMNSDIRSSGEFLLNISNEEKLELAFRNKSFSTNVSKDPLIFSPVKFSYDPESNLFLVKNKESIKMQWDKHKEKYRNSGNVSMIMVVERLYFKILLGLEYDILSSGCYIPFFLNIYNQNIDEDTVLKGMGWVLNPLAIPVSINYGLSKQQGNLAFFTGVILLDDEKLSALIADKNFRPQAKSYHFTKNFTIQSDIKIVYDLETGYIVSSVFMININGEAEGINEEISFELNQDGKESPLKPVHRSFII